LVVIDWIWMQWKRMSQRWMSYEIVEDCNQSIVKHHFGNGHRVYCQQKCLLSVKANCIKVHLSLNNTVSAFLSSGVRSGLIRVGDLKEAILVKAKVASVDRRNLIRIGLGQICICPDGKNP